MRSVLKAAIVAQRLVLAGAIARLASLAVDALLRVDDGSLLAIAKVLAAQIVFAIITAEIVVLNANVQLVAMLRLTAWSQNFAYNPLAFQVLERVCLLLSPSKLVRSWDVMRAT